MHREQSKAGLLDCATSLVRAGIGYAVARKPAKAGSALKLIPLKPTLKSIREAAKRCRTCDLWKRGTQTVFGDGARHARVIFIRVIFIGERPGDKEDLQCKPFVGPAGALLDKALAAVGIDRNQTYVTSTVKHFKWERRGKRRIPKKPNSLEIAACHPWLDAEMGNY